MSDEKTKAAELKACPFCGGRAIQVTTGTYKHRIACEDCDIQTRPYQDVRMCENVWNTRASL